MSFHLRMVTALSERHEYGRVHHFRGRPCCEQSCLQSCGLELALIPRDLPSRVLSWMTLAPTAPSDRIGSWPSRVGKPMSYRRRTAERWRCCLGAMAAGRILSSCPDVIRVLSSCSRFHTGGEEVSGES